MATISTFPQQSQHLDAADLATIVRRDIKRSFPGIAFTVRTHKYAGGSSVNIRWTDGPTQDAVDLVIGRYKAEGFDGMTDSRTNSGPVRLDDGRLVDIYSFIFTQRHHSDALRARVAGWFHRHFDGGYNGDVEMEINRATWRAEVVGNCLIVRKWA